MGVLSMSITKGEDVNECWNKFETVFGSTVFYNAPSWIFNKKDQKLKAKP